jgi:hypothetical protein
MSKKGLSGKRPEIIPPCSIPQTPIPTSSHRDLDMLSSKNYFSSIWKHGNALAESDKNKIWIFFPRVSEAFSSDYFAKVQPVVIKENNGEDWA